MIPSSRSALSGARTGIHRRGLGLALQVPLLWCAGCSAPPGGDLHLDLAARERGDLPGRRDAEVRDAAPAADRERDRTRGYGPPYPIVLAHGFFGFDKIGSIDYFWHVKSALQSAGHEVYIPTVNPFAGTPERGEQLLAQVKAILDQSGSARLNIVGHSQGGIDARYVAGKLPDRVAAVFTIAAPHLGTKVADAILGKAPGFSIALLDALATLVGRPLWGDIAKDPDLKASLESISADGMADFNVKFPDLPEVRYYSVTGRSSSSLAESDCFAPKAPLFISRYAGVKDPLEPLLFVTAKVIGGDNDGMVQVASAKWGTWLGCIAADHFDEVGQLLGDDPGPGNSFDHLTFYRDVASFLVSQGH
jgi:triacylglycerol lipase